MTLFLAAAQSPIPGRRSAQIITYHAGLGHKIGPRGSAEDGHTRNLTLRNGHAVRPMRATAPKG